MKQLIAHEVAEKGTWNDAVVDRVVLGYEDRFRRRIALIGENGTDILLSLKEARLLNGGDALLLADGRFIEVVAAPEKLIEISCDSAVELLRTVWHLGNRHLATEIATNAVRIRYDKVILEMVNQLGANTDVINAPFNPEGGAYSGGDTAVHSHDHHP